MVALLERTKNVPGNSFEEVHHSSCKFVPDKYKEYCDIGLKGKTVVISGASRGMGEGFAVRFARDGANVALLARTVAEDKTMPGTIHSVAKAVTAVGGHALAVKCDVTKEHEVKDAIKQVIDKFGGIDIVVNNASAHWPLGTIDLDMRRYDFMERLALLGSMLLTRECLPHLAKRKNPHVLFVAPAPVPDVTWLKPHVAYSATKIAMGYLAFGIQAEFPTIAVNCLWPLAAIGTLATYRMGGAELIKRCLSVAAMADAAYRMVTCDRLSFRGNFIRDLDLLQVMGVKDIRPYKLHDDQGMVRERAQRTRVPCEQNALRVECPESTTL